MNLDFVVCRVFFVDFVEKFLNLLSLFHQFVKWFNDVGSIEESFNCVLVYEDILRIGPLIVESEQQQQARQISFKSVQHLSTLLIDDKILNCRLTFEFEDVEQSFDDTLHLLGARFVLWQRLVEDYPEIGVCWDHLDQFNVIFVVEGKRVDIPGGWEHLLSRQDLVVSLQHFLLNCVNTHP